MKTMYYIVYVKYNQVKKYTENTILSAMRARLLKESTILSTLERFNLWALNEYTCVFEIFISSVLGAAEQGVGWQELPGHYPSATAISFVYHSVLSKYFLCVSSLGRLFNTNQGFIYMHAFIHIYVHTHIYIGSSYSACSMG